MLFHMTLEYRLHCILPHDDLYATSSFVVPLYVVLYIELIVLWCMDWILICLLKTLLHV